jgi:hypothetical protein
LISLRSILIKSSDAVNFFRYQFRYQRYDI